MKLTTMDESSGGFVVWCGECPSWRGIYPTKRDAILHRLRHEFLTHDNYNGNARSMYKRLSEEDKKWVHDRIKLGVLL